MRCLVTGASGFIGSHLTDSLLKEGHSVVGIDNFSSSDKTFLPIHKDFEFSCLDLGKQRLDLADFDYVFHLAAEAGVSACTDFPTKTFRSNVEATLNLLEDARRSGIKGFVYSSSSSVYGNIQRKAPIKENHPKNPASLYGVQKLASDNLVEMYAKYYGLRAVSLRYFNVYGTCRQRPRGAYSSICTALVETEKNEQPITIYGDGSFVRDFTHVYDVVEANKLLLKKPQDWQFWGSSYNIGTGRTTSVNEMVKLFGKKEIEYASVRPEDTPYSCADTRLSSYQLGFNASISVEKGLTILKKSCGIWHKQEKKSPHLIT